MVFGTSLSQILSSLVKMNFHFLTFIRLEELKFHDVCIFALFIICKFWGLFILDDIFSACILSVVSVINRIANIKDKIHFSTNGDAFIQEKRLQRRDRFSNDQNVALGALMVL